MLISNNRLVRWLRDKNRIRFVWPGGEYFRIEFDTSAQSRIFLKVLNRIAETPDNEESLIDELRSSGISDASEILKDLRAKGVLKWANGGVAVEAKTFHAFVEREEFRDDLADEDVLRLLCEARANQFEVDLTLPTPTMPPDLQSLFCETRSSYSSASDPISDSDISTLLALAYGRRQTLEDISEASDFRGTTASAGGFYPLRLVVKTRDTLESSPPFALQYQRSEHVFERLEVNLNNARWVESMTEFLSHRGLYLLISIMIDLRWSQVKYGNHAYRFALMEAGAIMQNLRLVSPRLGLRNWPCGLALGPWIGAMLPACGEYMHALSIGFGKGPEG